MGISYMKKILCLFGVSSAFIRGYGSVVDVFGTGASIKKTRQPREDVNQIAKDWVAVGNDMNWSITEYGKSRNGISANPTAKHIGSSS